MMVLQIQGNRNVTEVSCGCPTEIVSQITEGWKIKREPNEEFNLRIGH